MPTPRGDPPLLLTVPLPVSGPLPLSRNLSDPRLFVGTTPDERGYRPADAVALHYGRQRIPRRIVQLGQTWNTSLARYGQQMRSWWALNPEYEYRYMSDEQASAWLDKPTTRCSAQEKKAYHSLRLGAQRADLLRMLLCKYEGCVYGDLDMELLRPLREFIPSDASAVASVVWPLEILLYEPMHPIVTQVVALQTQKILEQVKLHRKGAHTQCRTPLSCVMRVTGPEVFLNGLHQTTQKQNCSNTIQRIGVGECAKATDDAFRRTHLCTDQVEVAGQPLLLCDAFRHHDCRTKKVCPKGHWQRRARPSSQYFRLDAR